MLSGISHAGKRHELPAVTQERFGPATLVRNTQEGSGSCLVLGSAALCSARRGVSGELGAARGMQGSAGP